jgi:hypothetical protein
VEGVDGRVSYQRDKINPGAFADILPPGAVLTMMPELPMREYKSDGIKCKVTDLRLLHPTGVEAVKIIFNTMMNEPDVEEVNIGLPDSMDEDTIEIMSDIVMGVRWRASKGGKHGFEMGGCIVYSRSTIETVDGKRSVSFRVDRADSAALYDFTHSSTKESISLFEAINAIINARRKECMDE